MTLQLLKAVNLQQTLRLLLDDSFPDHPLAPQFNRLMSVCPVLRTKFLGATVFEEPNPGNVEHEGTPFARIRVVSQIPLRKVPIAQVQLDKSNLIGLWEHAYQVRLLPGMRLRVQYWEKLTGILNINNHTRKLSVPVGSMVATRSNGERAYHRVRRIITLSVGELTRCFLMVEELVRAPSAEIPAAPYDVFETSGATFLLTLREIDTENLHFVQRTDNSWWWNPFVTHFL